MKRILATMAAVLAMTVTVVTPAQAAPSPECTNGSYSDLMPPHHTHWVMGERFYAGGSVIFSTTYRLWLHENSAYSPPLFIAASRAAFGVMVSGTSTATGWPVPARAVPLIVPLSDFGPASSRKMKPIEAPGGNSRSAVHAAVPLAAGHPTVWVDAVGVDAVDDRSPPGRRASSRTPAPGRRSCPPASTSRTSGSPRPRPRTGGRPAPRAPCCRWHRGRC